jgi:hypothetical protein
VFERWIKLFGDTCGELFEDPVVEAFAQMSRHASRREAFGEMRRP